MRLLVRIAMVMAASSFAAMMLAASYLSSLQDNCTLYCQNTGTPGNPIYTWSCSGSCDVISGGSAPSCNTDFVSGMGWANWSCLCGTNTPDSKCNADVRKEDGLPYDIKCYQNGCVQPCNENLPVPGATVRVCTCADA